MAAYSMIRRSTTLLALVLLGTSAASAQDLVAPDGSTVRRSKLERACGPALERFCPSLATSPGQTRNQVICLRPYRSSLQPYCRAAVNAAIK